VEAAGAASDAARRRTARDGIAVGVATGAYGLSFGALASAADLTVPQTVALSVLMFTGGSQFAFVGVVESGGNPLTGAATAILLGARNAFYGLRLSRLLRVHGLRRLVAAQLVVDETTAMAISHAPDGTGRVAFWSTGVSVFVLWNLATVVGAVGAGAFSDPEVLGLDAAAPAAFLALLAPRMRGREPWVIALTAAAVAIILTPFAPIGVPVLAAAAVALVYGGLAKPERAP
jgi:predicted branched-subunit amino acid permease